MRKTSLILACGVCVGLALCSCGKTPETPGPFTQTLGGSEYGAPTAKSHSDTGILQDQTLYRSASLTGGAGIAAATPGDLEAVAGAGASVAVRELLNNLLDDMESGEVAFVLGIIAEDQLGPLLDDYDFLYSTAELYERLTNVLADTQGDSAAKRMTADLRKLVTGPLKIDAVDENTATVTPNPLWILFGPSQASAALTIVQADGEWMARLDTPLTPDNVDRIRQYHEQLQEALDLLIEAVDNEGIKGRTAVYEALLRIAQGRELGLPSESEDGPETEEAEPEEAAEEDEGASPEESDQP